MAFTSTSSITRVDVLAALMSMDVDAFADDAGGTIVPAFADDA